MYINTGDVVKVMKKLPSEQMIPKPRKLRVNKIMQTFFRSPDLRELHCVANPTGFLLCSDFRSSVFTTVIPIMVSVRVWPFVGGREGSSQVRTDEPEESQN